MKGQEHVHRTAVKLSTIAAKTAVLIPVFAAVYYLTFWLRFEGQMASGAEGIYLSTVAWVIGVKLASFVGMRALYSSGKALSFYDLVMLAKAATVSLLTIALLNHALFPVQQIPRSIYLLDWGMTIVALGGWGAAVRVWCEHSPRFFTRGQVRVLIVGTGETGALMMRAICRTGGGRYRVVGFLSDDRAMKGRRIEGVRVVGDLDDACSVARARHVGQILVVQGELSGAQLRALIDDTRQLAIDVRVLPCFSRLIDGSVVFQPRSVSIEDLLQREPIELDVENIRNWIDGRVILVTGSAGSIGSEIARQLLEFSPRRVVLVDRAETGQFFLEREIRKRVPGCEVDVCVADVLDQHRMRCLLGAYRPDVIFHAAAYKHVPLMESHPEEAVRNIVVATRQLADLAEECGVGSFVMISTDKAVNPTSVMGACKRVAELYVQSQARRAACRFVTVRFGNVLDSAGSVIPIFRQQIAEGGPVTVTHPDMTRYFMTIPEAAQLVIQAGAIGQSGHILLLDMGKPVRIVDLAADMIRLSGLRVGHDVAIEYVGLRPGEKLYEELHANGEMRLPTQHPKIIVAHNRPVHAQDIRRSVEQLERVARSTPEHVRCLLAEIITEYQAGAQGPAEYRAAA